MPRFRLSTYAAAILFLVYLVNGVVAIPENSMVYDEMDHWSYGKRILKGHPEKVYRYDDASAMPITGLNAVPRAVEQLANPDLKKTDGGNSDVFHGRYVTLIVCLLIGIYIFKWSGELFGEWGGVFSLGLFVFCPNLNAHVILLTTDAYTALLMLGTFYYFYSFVKKGGNKRFLLFSLGFGLSQVVKYSFLHLCFLLGLISLVILWQRKSLLPAWRKNGLRLLSLFFITLIIINTAYFFKGTGRPLNQYQFSSAFFNNLKRTAVLNQIPVPLPVPYVEGIDITYHMTELGPGNPLTGPINYLNGHYKTKGGFWYYYAELILLKTPVPYLLLFAFLGYLYVKNRKSFSFSSAEFIILSGILYYLAYFSFFLSIQSGNRHIIFIYPLLYVLAGRLTTWPVNKKIKWGTGVVLALYSVAGFYFYFPNLISYTNELVPVKKDAYKYFADTNLDYGQGVFALEKYLKENPEVKMVAPDPQKGKIVISVNDYLDINGAGKYQWLRKYKPSGHINHCFLLFNIE